MPKARMLTGGIVDPGAGAKGAVVAFVAVSGGPRGSRLFKLRGSTDAPFVEEIASATTIDLGRFDREAHDELGPVLAAIEAEGGKAAVARPSADWVTGHVRKHLAEAEGLTID